MDTINDNLSLTVINDRDGSQCGYSYRARLTILASNRQTEVAQAALRMVQNADGWMRKRGYEGCPACVLIGQAALVVEYYVEHLADQYQPHDTGAA